jgi:carboxymethylenebutenolidase
MIRHKANKSLALAALFALGISGSAYGQDWAKENLAKSPRHGEYTTITEPGGRKLQAWVVYPEVKEKAPVVLMIHEIFGLSDWAREMADEVAGAGYIVVEPDLLSGFGPPPAAAGLGCDPMDCAPGQTPTRTWHADVPRLVSTAYELGQQPAAAPTDHSQMQGAHPGAAYVPATPGGTAAFPDQSAVTKAVSSLDAAQVTADLDAAADYGKHLPSANGKLFVAGFCWGGGKTFLFATHRKDLSGAFVFYGPPPPAEAMKGIVAPVYGFYAGLDARITSMVPQTTTDMKAAGKTYDPVVYDGAGHGFMRAGEAPEATAANAAARAAGFRRLIQLLGGVH